ncbi:MAG TPA: hypothetical protein VH741_02650, partial [Candidatus Limnocylindrales bacterium]
MPEPTQTRPPTRLLAAALALTGAAVALPLAVDLLALAGDPARQLVAPSLEMAWAAALLALIVGWLVALAVWPGRAAWRGAALG